MSKPVSISTLLQLKAAGEKFSCLTAYDATFANVVSEAGVEVMLVGDSLGMVLQGHDSTLPVTIEDMIYHVESVKRGNTTSLIMADMPFNTYSDPVTAVENAGLLMQAGANIVKLEGKAWLAPTLTTLAQAGIPTCAHLGLTPQFVNVFGGYKVQGKEDEAAAEMIENAQMLAHAGASIILLECVPAHLAQAITAAVDVPVIGIGAGADTDGQVLVLHDMLGITLGKPAKFVKNFLAESASIPEAISAYHDAVKSKAFPSEEHTFA